jgi:Ca2+-binding RTX toxin-like protein
VHGCNGGNTLTGNALGNILIGGTGADTITGGSGRSLLIGDQGADQITGGSGGSASGGDILVGGTTIWDSDTNAHFQALISILAEWQSGNSYASRVSHLRLGGGLNGSNKLIWGTTVKDDGVANVLTAATSASSPAVDWFFTGAFDTAVNTESGEANNNGIY